MVRVEVPLVDVAQGVQVFDSPTDWALTFERADARPAVVAAAPVAAPAAAPAFIEPPAVAFATPPAPREVVWLSELIGVAPHAVLHPPKIMVGSDIADVTITVAPEAVARRRERDGDDAVETISLDTLPNYGGPRHVLRAVGVKGAGRLAVLQPGRRLNWLAYYLVVLWPDAATWESELGVALDVSASGDPFRGARNTVRAK